MRKASLSHAWQEAIRFECVRHGIVHISGLQEFSINFSFYFLSKAACNDQISVVKGANGRGLSASGRLGSYNVRLRWKLGIEFYQLGWICVMSVPVHVPRIANLYRVEFPKIFEDVIL